jgi:hypothetical protein
MGSKGPTSDKRLGATGFGLDYDTQRSRAYFHWHYS